MVCAAELLDGNLLRDADFDSLFLCTAFHESDLTLGPEPLITGYKPTSQS